MAIISLLQKVDGQGGMIISWLVIWNLLEKFSRLTEEEGTNRKQFCWL